MPLSRSSTADSHDSGGTDPGHRAAAPRAPPAWPEGVVALAATMKTEPAPSPRDPAPRAAKTEKQKFTRLVLRAPWPQLLEVGCALEQAGTNARGVVVKKEAPPEKVQI